jgi:hypothetical protein
MEAIEIMKEAKNVERSLNQNDIGWFKRKAKNLHNELHGRKPMGSSFYRPVKNTATGNNVMEHVLTIGMPGANTGWSVSQNNALASFGIGALGTTSLALAFTNFEKSQNGGAAANKKQRRRALGQLIGAGICFAILSPGTYQWPIQGSSGDSNPRTTGPLINNPAT